MLYFFKKINTLFALLFILSLQANAQDVNTLITNYGDKYSPDRLYIHYDKSSYASGETI